MVRYCEKCGSQLKTRKKYCYACENLETEIKDRKYIREKLGIFFVLIYNNFYKIGIFLVLLAIFFQIGSGLDSNSEINPITLIIFGLIAGLIILRLIVTPIRICLINRELHSKN